MATDLATFGLKIDRLSRELSGGSLRKITGNVANQGKADVLREIDRSVLGSDRKFSGWKRVKFGAGYELPNDHTAVIAGRPAGPWTVAETGRFPGRKYSRKRRRVVGWGPTRGFGIFAKATQVIERETPGRVATQVRAAMERVF